jgi:hypothetical protein
VDDQGRSVTDCSTGPLSLSRMIIRPDPFNENDNPLYEMLHRNYEVDRGRFLGSANVRWEPISCLSLDGNVSYDRLDYNERTSYPKGYRDIRDTAGTRDGRLYRYSSRSEGLNASLTGTLRQTFGRSPHARSCATCGSSRTEWTGTTGFQFRVAMCRVRQHVSENISATSGTQPVRSDGYFGITNLMYADKYIVDALIRNDGSSLFGSDQRRQWYYRRRVPGASRGAVLPVPGRRRVQDPLRHRYGRRPAVMGGAVRDVLGDGGRRAGHAGQPRPASGAHDGAGGRDRRRVPAAASSRRNYASGRTTDQILSVPQPAYTGFATRG